MLLSYDFTFFFQSTIIFLLFLLMLLYNKPSTFSLLCHSHYLQDIFHFSTVKQERGLDYPYARSFNLSVSLLFN